MKVLASFLTIVLLLIVFMLLLPVISIGVGMFGVIALVAIWILPMWIIATSDKTTGLEKIAWLLTMVCLSWFAWIFYFLLAPLKPKFPRHEYY